MTATRYTVNSEIELSVVGKRCVYLNNLRVAGNKPYISENLPTHHFTIRVQDILDAMPMLQLNQTEAASPIITTLERKLAEATKSAKAQMDGKHKESAEAMLWFDKTQKLKQELASLERQLADTKTMLTATAEAAATHLKQLAKAREALDMVKGFLGEHNGQAKALAVLAALKDQSQ
jgi:hypothetical protein